MGTKHTKSSSEAKRGKPAELPLFNTAITRQCGLSENILFATYRCILASETEIQNNFLFWGPFVFVVNQMHRFCDADNSLGAED